MFNRRVVDLLPCAGLGSLVRATKEATAFSDYDLVFEWDMYDEKLWGEFTSCLRENNPTLFSLDLARWDQINNQLKERVLAEGRIIYEKA